MKTNSESENIAIEKAQRWLNAAIDDETRSAIEHMLRHDSKALTEAFHNDLDFGTGGLRGVMGVGSNRINRYTIGMTTQGLANYLKKQFSGEKISVAIAHDSRNNSDYFTKVAADVLSANGIHVFLFRELRPTPLLSFAVRHLKCNAGIVITASHNPRQYNGYKVYWNDGAQVVPPYDKGIIAEVRSVNGIESVSFSRNEKLVHVLDDSVEEAYLSKLQTVIHSKEEIAKAADLKIVYTSIHGTGITIVPKALSAVGFSNIQIVEEQSAPDGNFPTVKSPNPEEKEALDLALQLAEKTGADLVLATDPDADRVGIAVRNNEGKMVLLNGNQAGSLIVYYALMQWQRKDILDGRQFVAKTIVTTELIAAIAKKFGVKCYDTLTGFKYIAEVMRSKEGTEYFICGGEESYGYLVGDFVRDKDAVISSIVLSEIAAWCHANSTTIWQLLQKIYSEFGFYFDELFTKTIEGLDGLKAIDAMMTTLRINPAKELAGSRVVKLVDVQQSTTTDVLTGKISTLDLPHSNVLQFFLEDGSKISARPSGTEPKIKFYFSLRGDARNLSYENFVEKSRIRISEIKIEMNL
ncbi:MAG: phospho-sugar mutase [Flavobacteriales bacterium]|nr:phospho-sugar mutase [Flavobacteriales bacterium]